MDVGGEGGIRTLDRLLTYTHFPGVLLKPLGHLSGRLQCLPGAWRRTWGLAQMGIPRRCEPGRISEIGGVAQTRLVRPAIPNLPLARVWPGAGLSRRGSETVEHEVEQVLPGVEGQVLNESPQVLEEGAPRG